MIYRRQMANEQKKQYSVSLEIKKMHIKVTAIEWAKIRRAKYN